MPDNAQPGRITGALPREPGYYWYLPVAPDPLKEHDAVYSDPCVVELRAGETFLRFTSGARQAWARGGDQFVGPLAQPARE